MDDHRELDSICFIPTLTLGFDRSRSWTNNDLTIEQVKDIFEKENRFSQGAIVADCWKAGNIIRRTGPVSYDVQVGDRVEHS